MSQQTRDVLKSYFESGDTPTEAEFIDLIDSLVNYLDDVAYKYKKITVLSDDIKTLGSAPVELVASPGAGKAIELMSWVIRLTYNSAVYTGVILLDVKTDSANQVQGNDNEALASTVTRIQKGEIITTDGGGWPTTDTQIIADKALELSTGGGSPASGDSDIDIYLAYRILDL